ncbi:MAG TPA: cytidine deaminase, partial [Thermoanaerobaculia bacterium]|nr:cytidine deaminase [Thermoanaerobaculia bacterium]
MHAVAGGAPQQGLVALEQAAQVAVRDHAEEPAALVDDGRVVTGANIENASYGVGLCAECSLVSALWMGGGGRLDAFACVDGAGDPLMPCGRCRQLLYEHSAP